MVALLTGMMRCLLLMFSRPAENWERLFLWLGLGLLIYFGYGRRQSVVARLARNEAPALPAPRTVADEGETA